MRRATLPLLPTVGLGAATTGVAALGAAGFVSASAAGATTCLFAAVTGVPCPFCGLTHGVAELGAGHPRAALALHPLAPLALALALAALAASLRRRPPAVPPIAIAALSGLVLLTWIARLA